MRAYCYTCKAETIVGSGGACGFCDAAIVTQRKASQHRGVGAHSYIGTEDLYARAYARYLEVRSVRKVAAEVWEAAGYANAHSCAVVLHDAFAKRGWPTYRRAYANTRHGLLKRDARDAEYRRRQRVERGEIRGVQCSGVKSQAPGNGRRCSRPALAGGEYCRAHDPERRAEVLAGLEDARAKAATA